MSSCNNQKVIFFAEGPGYIFIAKLAKSGLSKVMIVQSLEDGALCVRKESVPYPRNPAHNITSTDVRAIKHIQHLEAIPLLRGWTEYHDEVRSNNAVTATYWDLYNAGTLEDIKDHVRRTNEPVSECFFISILRQMLKTMLDTIKAGVLHTDAHAGNWLLHVVNSGNDARLMLGDWGNWMSRPKINEHLPNEVCAQHNSDCELCQWYLHCHIQLKDYVVQNMRDLLHFTHEANRAQLTAIPQETAVRPSVTLTNHLRVIEVLDPSWHQAGEKWLQKLDDAYDDIVNHEQRMSSGRSTMREKYNKYRQNHPTAIPTFQDALKQVDWLDDNQRGPTENFEIVHFWKVAEFDQRTNTVVSLESRPNSYRRNVGFRDHTERSHLPLAWRQAHDETKEMLKMWGTEEEQEEDQAASGFQDKAGMTRYIDTSMPF